MEAETLAAENGSVFEVNFLRKIQRQIFESKNEFTICTFFGQGCDERTTGKRFFSENFFRCPLQVAIGSIRDAWELTGCVEARIRDAWKLTGACARKSSLYYA